MPLDLLVWQFPVGLFVGAVIGAAVVIVCGAPAPVPASDADTGEYPAVRG